MKRINRRRDSQSKFVVVDFADSCQRHLSVLLFILQWAEIYIFYIYGYDHVHEHNSSVFI